MADEEIRYLHGITRMGVPFEVVRNGLNSYAVHEPHRDFVVNKVDLLLYLLEIQFDLEHNLGPRYEQFKNQIRDG